MLEAYCPRIACIQQLVQVERPLVEMYDYIEMLQRMK